MATKSKTSRTAKRSKVKQFQFRWWMGVLIVGIVGVVGIAVFRFSNASGQPLRYVPIWCNRGDCRTSYFAGANMHYRPTYSNGACSSGESYSLGFKSRCYP